tara:strand:+ start:2488 stop:3174 length:687 start_codon:yes stop_codon:yes gene_type:complete
MIDTQTAEAAARKRHVDDNFKKMMNWRRIKHTILPALINDVELTNLHGAVEFCVINALANHYMTYYWQDAAGRWSLLNKDVVLFNRYSNDMHEQAIINLNELKKKSIVTPEHTCIGDHALISFNTQGTNAIPMRTSIIDSQLMMGLLSANFNVSMQLQRYFLSWAPLEDKLIVTQDPNRIVSAAKEHGLDIGLSSPILGVAAPGFSAQRENPFQVAYSDITPHERCAH